MKECLSFNEYRNSFNRIKMRLFERYVSRFIKKEIKIKDVEYPLRPLLYDLHNHYQESGEKINRKANA